jgi:dolichol-phosphate mannosyltransferase
MLISYVIPVCNEEKGFQKFYNELLLPEIKKTKLDYEIILVNDGSTDKSLQIIQSIAEADKHVKVISFSRNFGKEVSLTAGLREATGDAAITMDADGQQPPVLIHEFIKKWQKEDAEIVVGVRGKYEKHGLVAKLGSKLFYKMLGVMGVKDTVPGSTDFRLIDRVVIDEFNKLTEHGRITRGLMDWMGFKKVYVDYVYGNRLAGKPSYNFSKLFHLALDSFISLSTTPLVVFMWIGVFISLASGILGLFSLIEEYILRDPLGLNWTDTTHICIFISFLVGLVLISQGITSLYISHIYAEAQNRPLYIIDKKRSRNLKKKD